ncbi:hypothetical protein CCH79_00018940 [Gambusia affinis]|uniref:Uncharacterized protein n=1 Tax=Gambusia affinis TaxID=33528 RepID=A0A315VJX6_GAMAF|nr:hypothetical protein CCH79_00018940 [Gambusia affinis]
MSRSFCCNHGDDSFCADWLTKVDSLLLRSSVPSSWRRRRTLGDAPTAQWSKPEYTTAGSRRVPPSFCSDPPVSVDSTSHDESLFPPTLSEARCLLKGCLDLEGKEDQNLQSRPIWYQVMVLKRVRTEGAEHSYHYRLETRNVPVGCTCVRHMVHVQE